MMTILDSFIYHKHLYRVGKWGAVSSHGVAGGLQFEKFKQPNGLCFELHMSQYVATSMPSLDIQSCGDSLVEVCLAR